MLGKIFSLLVGLGIGTATVKLISDKIADNAKSNILSMLYAARKQYDAGELTQLQYDETLKILHKSVSEKDRKAIDEELEERYFIAEDMLNTHIELLDEIEEAGAASLQEYIEKHPNDAYINGIVGLDDYVYEEGEKSPEEAERLLKKYIYNVGEEKKELIAEVKMLGGDIDRVQRIFDKITFE